jgi:hypothetical protein
MLAHVACGWAVGKATSLNEMTNTTGFVRHVRVCNNVDLPGDRLRLLIGQAAVGWVAPNIAAALAGAPGLSQPGDGNIILTDPSQLPALCLRLTDRGLSRTRGEQFDVRADPDGPSLARIDRGAIPQFGVRAHGVHVNGLVETPAGLKIWVARRASNKTLDPGKLDHVVAGGVPAGLGPWETVIKEAAEEAAIPEALARSARLVGHIGYAMARPEGLRRDLLYCYDLILPATFTPVPADGEVEAFELWPIERAMAAVRDTDDFKFNVNLVLIDLFIRRGLIDGAEAVELRAGLANGIAAS